MRLPYLFHFSLLCGLFCNSLHRKHFAFYFILLIMVTCVDAGFYLLSLWVSYFPRPGITYRNGKQWQSGFLSSLVPSSVSMLVDRFWSFSFSVWFCCYSVCLFICVCIYLRQDLILWPSDGMELQHCWGWTWTRGSRLASASGALGFQHEQSLN